MHRTTKASNISTASDTSWNSLVRHQLLLLAVCASVLFLNLGSARLWDRDEPRNAGCAYEMLERQDWVVPMFNAELRTHKPVLLYWCMMTAYAVFGVNEFAARFWSAVAATATVLVTYHLGRRLFSPRAGLWSGLALSTCLMFGVAGRAATPDALLIFCTTLGLATYAWLAFPPSETLQSSRPSHLSRASEGSRPVASPDYYPATHVATASVFAVFGVAVLAKGPVGIVLPVAVIVAFRYLARLPQTPTTSATVGYQTAMRALAHWLQPRHGLRTLATMRWPTALMATLAVAAPWYVWVGLRTDGAWLRGFFLEHNLGRALTPMEGHDGPAILFYLVALLVGTFPWSVLAVPTSVFVASQLRRTNQQAAGVLFAVCWVGVYIGAFSLAQTKLPSYITPTYPAVGLLLGLMIDRWLDGELIVSTHWWRAVSVTLLLAGFGITAGLVFAGIRYLPGEASLGLLGLVPLAGGAMTWVFLTKQQPQRVAVSLAVTATVFATGLFAYGTTRIDQHQQSDVLLSCIPPTTSPSQLAAYGCLEPSWVFYARRPIRELTRRQADEAVSFLTREDSHYLITSSHDFEKIGGHLPRDVGIVARVPYFLRKSELLLLGPLREPAIANGAADTDRR